ncbi:MAG: hypothetical protein KBT75_06785 [Oleispira antarctica]|nr:hypothetical protein [Oleispira antarctica]MBQ0792234.1 hypothetical protein [Oleispira antarctica]
MSLNDAFMDMSLALGQGIYSVGEDVVFGFNRTTEGLGLGENGRMLQIGYENRILYALFNDLIKFGIENKNSPLFKAISVILEHYYSSFSDENIKKIAHQAGVGASYSLGRMVLGKKLAEAIALRIATTIAATTVYKTLASKISVSSGASATGIGAPIGLLMMQGVLQRSSIASQRLKINRPKLHNIMQQNGNLQFIYFIVEKPMEKYIHSIPRI